MAFIFWRDGTQIFRTSNITTPSNKGFRKCLGHWAWLHFIFRKRVIIGLRGGWSGHVKLLARNRILLSRGFCSLEVLIESEIMVRQLLIFLMLTINLNEWCLLLGLLTQRGFDCLCMFCFCSSTKNAFGWVFRMLYLLLWSFGNKRFWRNSLRRWCFRSIDCVLTMRNVSLSRKLCKFPLAKRARHSWVWRWRYSCCQLVYLCLSSSILHDIIHFPCHLDSHL